MKQEDLQRVQPGFDNPVGGSQAVFRQALQALSLPGRPTNVPPAAPTPARGQRAAAQLLLALLDSDCTLWLSPSLAGTDTQAWLRFHTGCQCVTDPSQARFLWLAAGDAWPTLAQMPQGSDESPEQSATCVMEVAGWQPDAPDGWRWQGPGIKEALSLMVTGLPADFDQQWAANHHAFPRGVDVFLASGDQLVGLPRSAELTPINPHAQEA